MTQQRAPSENEADPIAPGSGDGMVPRDVVAQRLSPTAVEEQFRILFHNHIEERQITLGKAAERMEMSPRNLQRILAGDQKMTTQLLVELGNAFAIDKSRAVVAIERFQSWQAYYDPTLITAVDLLRPVVERINARGGVAEPLHPKAIEQLANWIADVIIDHQEQIARRREEIGTLPKG